MVDTDGEPCTGNQDVTIWLVSVEDEVITQTNIVSETSATYVVSFQPRKSGQHMINVKVNGKAIKGSPFRLFVNNIPHPQNCKALGDGVKQAEKYKKSKFMVELADADNEPCATKQVITALLKSLAGSVIKASVLSKTTATYEVSYQPNKAGQHELHVAVNDMPIKGSPFALLVSNIPDPSHSCKAVGDGVKIAEKGVNAMFLVQLADADGEPCVTEQNVTVALKSTADGLGTNSSVVKLTAATYEVTYQPTKSGEYELIVKVNSISIKGSPFKVFVFNVPHPQNCIGVGEGVQQAEKSKKSKFVVQLTDVAGEPCITKQEVTVVLKCLADNAVAKGTVVSKTAAIYEASYQPSKSGEHQLFVEVNGKLINGSPFLLLVSSIPNPQNCKVVGDGVKLAEKNKRTKIIVQLADGDGEPCVTRQEVTVALKSTADGLITNASVAKRVNAAIYEATYQLTRSGTHEIQVKVNSVPIKGSPFPLFVYDIPHPQNCKVLGDGVKQAEKNKESKFTVELADAENELCVTKQEVTTTLKCLADDSATNINLVHITAATYEVSYQPNKAGQHELHVAVNGMPIKGSPFALLVRDGAKTGANRLSRFRSRTQTVGAFGEHKELGTKKGPNRKLRRRSSFPDYRQDRTIQIQGLELFSPNVEARIREKVCRAIEVKYGGQSTQAAISIQRAYRDYKLKKRFEEIRREASQMRKRAESLRADPIRRPSIVRKRRELNGKDPLLLAQEASKKLANRRGGYNWLQIGHESDSKENPQKLKFQINSATLDKTSTDPSKEASKPFAFSSDKLYQRHRPSIFTASVSTNNLEELRQQVEQERAMKQRKYSQATIQRKTSIGINHFNRYHIHTHFCERQIFALFTIEYTTAEIYIYYMLCSARP